MTRSRWAPCDVVFVPITFGERAEPCKLVPSRNILAFRVVSCDQHAVVAQREARFGYRAHPVYTFGECETLLGYQLNSSEVGESVPCLVPACPSGIIPSAA